MSRIFSKYKPVAAADIEFSSIDFPVTDSKKLKLIPRFLSQDVENKTEKEKEQYLKRDNVGNKTRWYKLEEMDRPHGQICMAQDLDSNAQNYFLQALLAQMDSKLHEHFEKDLKQA